MVEIQQMELRYLRYFIAVAEELNFSRAAERLNIAQPPLSQQIKELEEKLGVQLFDRKKRPLQLTIAGEVFLEDAHLVIATLERAIRSVRRAGRGEVGRLVVAVNSSIANSVLPDILQSFRDRFPDVRLILREIASFQQAEEIRNQQIDVGFERLPSKNSNDPTLKFMPIFRESLVVALPKNHRLAAKTQISLEELANEPFVFPSTDLVPSYGQIISLCQDVGFYPNIVQEATWMITILSLVAGGVGVTLLPANAQNLQRTGVVYRPLEGQNLTRQIAVVWRRDDSSPILQNFLEVTKNIAQNR
jgi:DNA-binding transcriptional LysR family regulator